MWRAHVATETLGPTEEGPMKVGKGTPVVSYERSVLNNRSDSWRFLLAEFISGRATCMMKPRGIKKLYIAESLSNFYEGRLCLRYIELRTI